MFAFPHQYVARIIANSKGGKAQKENVVRRSRDDSSPSKENMRTTPSKNPAQGKRFMSMSSVADNQTLTSTPNKKLVNVNQKPSGANSNSEDKKPVQKSLFK